MPAIPDHWRKGWLRLYLVLTIPWVIVFGYFAYDAHRVYAANRDHTEMVDSHPGTDRRYYMEAAVLRDRFQKERDWALKWLLVAPLGIPFLIIAFIWIRAGFLPQDPIAK